MARPDAPVLLLDLDGSVFNTSRWAREWVQPALAQAAGVETEVMAAWFEQYKAGLEKYTDFSHTTFAPLLAEAFQLTVAKIERIYFDSSAIAACVFEDVLTTLPKLTQHFRLGVFSEAEPEFQRRKLEAMNILQWLQPELIYIFRRKETPEAVRQLPLPVTIVDDNPRVIAFLQTFADVTPIWINRTSLETHPAVTTINTLQSLV